MAKSVLKDNRERVEYVDESPKTLFPIWMNWIIISILFIIALSCTLNLVFNMADRSIWPFKVTNETMIIDKHEYDIAIDSIKNIPTDLNQTTKNK